AGQLGEQRAVADLPGPMPFRLMQDGLAVEAHDADLTRLQTRLRQKPEHHGAMALSQLALQPGRWIPLAIGGFQPGAEGRIIGLANPWAGLDDPFAVGLQQRRIDPVAAGAAHQAYGPYRIGHSYP